ncbi:ADIPOR-like receptor Izh2p [Trichomonascus vanleenenianus]|uniref:hemolysin III family protein n=1 Tax=Trichomonascus vanleenenianus TaxID=2268995 RepID=UPI003ECB7D54
MAVRQRKEAGEPESLVESIEHKVARLCHWDDLPEWQKDNHYILTGYVRETLSWRKTLHSLLYVHNETGNIYSHLLPSLACLFAALVTLDYFMPHYATTTWADHAAILTFCMGAIACLGLSSAFHTLKSHSDRIATFGNKLDYLGIVVLINASMVSMIYYGMYEHHTLRNLLWGLITAIGVGCATVSLDDTFRTPDWRAFRASMFVAYGLSGVLPVLIGFYVMGIQEACQRTQIGWVVLEGALYISGACLYAMRVPERFKPGAFDIWGHSHQLFHLLVVLAAMSHGWGLLNAYNYTHSRLASVSGETLTTY